VRPPAAAPGAARGGLVWVAALRLGKSLY
jgi:hypothetical protein